MKRRNCAGFCGPENPKSGHSTRRSKRFCGFVLKSGGHKKGGKCKGPAPVYGGLAAFALNAKNKKLLLIPGGLPEE